MKEYSEFCENSLISNNNSIRNTPVKPPHPLSGFGHHHHNGSNSNNNGNGSGIRSNHYSLTSPFKPVKPDAYDVEKNFGDQHGIYSTLYLQSSPIFGR